jgi:hypothetical protein
LMQKELLDIATCFMRIVGVIGCWGVIYRVAQTKWGRDIGGRYGGLAFFLHSAHWPLLVIMKTMLWPIVPNENDVWMLVHYVTSVALTVVTGVGLGKILAHKAPRFFALMNGGRLLGESKARD